MSSGTTNEPGIGIDSRGGAKEQKLFGRYTLKRVLGRGGMGIVWLAHDEELNRYVAMKFLPDMLVRDREAVEDLKRETRRSLDLTHHHIVRIYDFTQDEMCAAIIMEFVDGETLSAMKTQQPGGCFGVSVLAPWVAHFASALDYAHRQALVIHRDLKPANLMINSRGDLKITDFGISRSMSDSLTRVSVSNTAGTLAYMSPEQALGAPPAPHDDVYAFGATVFDLLTGRPPFFRGNLQVQLETVIPPRMGDRRTELGNSGEPIPELWEEVIATCLAKRPQDRPESIAAVAAMLGLSGVSAGFRPGTDTGSTVSGATTGVTRTRMRPAEDAGTEEDRGSATPRTSQPSTNRPTAGGRPTGLEDVISAPSPREQQIIPQQAPASAGSASATIPPEELTLSGEKLAAPVAPSRSPDRIEAAPAASPAGLVGAPDSAPARKSPSLALAALGSIALIAVVGAWMYLNQSETPKIAAPIAPAVVQIAPVIPTPTYEKEIATIREAIAAERATEAADSIGKLPADLPAIADLRAALTTLQTDLTKRETMQRDEMKRVETIAQLLRDSDGAFAKNDWNAARSPLTAILNVWDPTNVAAKTRLQAVNDAEAKIAEQQRMATAEQERVAEAKLQAEMKEKADADAAARMAEQKKAADKPKPVATQPSRKTYTAPKKAVTKPREDPPRPPAASQRPPAPKVQPPVTTPKRPTKVFGSAPGT